MRHAKSDWSNSDLDDFERPLNKRGRNAAPKMGRELRRLGLVPDLVYCSAAVRAGETWRRLDKELTSGAKVESDEDLYMAAADVLFDRLICAPDEAGTVMMVGHNPEMHVLAARFAESSNDGDDRLERGFPTAAVAVFDCECERWRDLRPGLARLVRYMTPKSIEED